MEPPKTKMKDDEPMGSIPNPLCASLTPLVHLRCACCDRRWTSADKNWKVIGPEGLAFVVDGKKVVIQVDKGVPKAAERRLAGAGDSYETKDAAGKMQRRSYLKCGRCQQAKRQKIEGAEAAAVPTVAAEWHTTTTAEVPESSAQGSAAPAAAAVAAPTVVQHSPGLAVAVVAHETPGSVHTAATVAPGCGQVPGSVTTLAPRSDGSPPTSDGSSPLRRPPNLAASRYIRTTRSEETPKGVPWTQEPQAPHDTAPRDEFLQLIATQHGRAMEATISSLAQEVVGLQETNANLQQTTSTLTVCLAKSSAGARQALYHIAEFADEAGGSSVAGVMRHVADKM